MPLCAANCHRGRRPKPLERRSGAFARRSNFSVAFARGERQSAQPFSTEGGDLSRWKDGPELLPNGQISLSLLRGANAILRSHLAQRAAASAAGKTVRSFCRTVNFLRRFCER